MTFSELRPGDMWIAKTRDAVWFAISVNLTEDMVYVLWQTVYVNIANRWEDEGIFTENERPTRIIPSSILVMRDGKNVNTNCNEIQATSSR